MSRTSTSTPPPQPYFPQRTSTPSMRHASAPTISAAHFASRASHSHQQQTGKRRTKNLPSSGPFGVLSPSRKAQKTTSTPEVGTFAAENREAEQNEPAIYRSESALSVISTTGSLESYNPSARSQTSLLSTQSLSSEHDSVHASAPSMTASSLASVSSTPLQTPISSRAPSLNLHDGIIIDSASAPDTPGPACNVARQSWVPSFGLGKMAKAALHAGISFGDKRKGSPRPVPPGAAQADTTPMPAMEGLAVQPMPQSTVTQVQPLPVQQPDVPEEGELSEEERIERQRRREWAEAEHARVLECAKLCSQWPQSAYNCQRCSNGPPKTFYEPQSYSNPQYVASIMHRQATLEQRFAAENAVLHVASSDRRSRDSVSTDSSTSSSERASRQSSPATSMHMSIASVDSEDKREKDLKEAMGDCLLDGTGGAGAAMDVDPSPRSQSCGSKRPLAPECTEEEKRRKVVDEQAVLNEAIRCGVIQPSSSVPSSMSSSTPNLGSSGQQQSAGPALFGVVVKTSDSHPIVISSYLPAELIPHLEANLVSPARPDSAPLLLASQIDVPSALLSFPPAHCPNFPKGVPANVHIVPTPVSPALGGGGRQGHRVKLGNMLLSSCPGKRLRMDGAVKGRSPVCRDLKTDLGRIKGEGVGCLICCLDDDELALLGVPWETYREVANEIGLDVVRLPMPDGFTPSSYHHFDQTITLILQRYTLRGISCLTHCRGGVGRAGLTASAWAIKLGLVPPHPSFSIVEDAALSRGQDIPAQLEHQIVMSVVERSVAMIRARRGLKAIESYEQVRFLVGYVGWLREGVRRGRFV